MNLKESGRGRNYNNLESEISRAKYYALDETEKNYYTSECYHKKISKNEGNRKKKEENNRLTEIARKQKQRANEIESRLNPNLVISQSEYNKLKPETKALWISTSVQTGRQEYTDMYRRKVPQDEKNTLNWKAEHVNGIKLYPWEYNKLKPEIKALGWVITSVQNRRQEYTDMYRRKVPQDEKNILNWKAEHVKGIKLYPHEYNKLKPETKALGWVITSVQTGSQEYTDMYRRKVPQDDELSKILPEIEKIEGEMDTILKEGKIYNSKPLPPNSILLQKNRNTYYILIKPRYNRYKVLESRLFELYQEKSIIENILSQL
jgi:hypothetical protein